MTDRRIDKFLTFIPEKAALRISLAIMLSLSLFHLLILAGELPFTLFWENTKSMSGQMITYETALVAADLILVLILCARSGILRFLPFELPGWIIRNTLNISCMLFAFNTLTDFYTADSQRDVIFASVSLLMAYLTGSVIYQTNTSTTSTTL